MTEEVAIKLSSHEIEEVELPQISHKDRHGGLRTWEDVIWQEFSLSLIMRVIFPRGVMKSL